MRATEPLSAKTAPCEIFCDFDGTVTCQDVTDLLLGRLADPQWLDIEHEWQHGKIGSRECMARQVPLIRGDWSAVQEVLKEVTFDSTFKNFVSWCKNKGIHFTLVSEGLDKVIKYLLHREGISVDALIANQLHHNSTDGFWLSFNHATVSDPGSNSMGRYAGCAAGVCKCMVLARAEETIPRVVIGDGRSDFCWAEKADILFAKKSLLTHANEIGLNVQPFTDFNTIQQCLEGLSISEAVQVPQYSVS